jgi:hypothetical protein
MSEIADDWSATAELMASMGLFANPQLTEKGLTDRFGPRSEWTINPGQIWRIVGERVNALVLILRIGETNHVHVSPITLEKDIEAEGTAIADQGDETIGSPVVVWAELSREIPNRLLDRPVGDLGVGIANWVLGVGALPSNFKQSKNSVLLRDKEAKERIQSDFDELGIEMDWHSPRSSDVQSVMRTPTAEELEELKTSLNLPLPQVLELVDGTSELSEDQAEVVLLLLGGLPASARIPSELIAEIDHPHSLNLVKAIKQREKISDINSRKYIARQVLALAARQTGSSTIDWRSRLNQWADAQHLTQNE